MTDRAQLRALIEECSPQRIFGGRGRAGVRRHRSPVPVFDQRGRVVAALNSSSHSRRTTKTKLLRERLTMLQQVSQQISADLATVPWLSLSAQT